jgi:phosphatidylserine/phosphatidylglycerophosphate/cardiolipin synthase-like enzyme
MKFQYLFIFSLFLLVGCSEIDLDTITGEIIADILVDEEPTEINTFIQDTGDVQVYFCPQEDCETALVNLIDSAEEYIHCAFFEVDLDKVRDKLLEKEKEIEVLVVTDNDYLYEFNHSFVKFDTWGLMHNKFCIIDGKKISSGSMNPTNNGATKNNNNLLIIESSVLATNYEAEFQEMYDGTFKKGDKTLNTVVDLNGITIKNYFCPEDSCAEMVKEELKKAQKSIHLMTFSFTDKGIANILLMKKLDNVSISGVMEARQVTKYSVYELLKYQDVDVIKDGNKQNMHHKVFIVDEETVITGSMNPTGGGNKRNDENVLIITDKKIAEEFMEEFDRVYSEATLKD